MPAANIQPVTPYPALLFREGRERTVIVADLHIGWEISLSSRGIHIPSQTPRILARLSEVLKKARPTRLVLLGDVKQAVPTITMEEWKYVPEFIEAVQKMVKDVIIVPGNHDGDIEPLTPRSTTIASSNGIVIGKKTPVAIFHGHAWPKVEALACEAMIMSHIHPVIRFRDRMGMWTVKQVWVRGRLDAAKATESYLKYLNITPGPSPRETFKERLGVDPRDPRLIIMPTFNDLVGGLSVNRLSKRLTGPILGSGGVNLGSCELYLLDGTFLGAVSQFSLKEGEQ